VILLCPLSVFFGRCPSFEFLQTLEECKLQSITFTELNELYEQYPLFNKVGRLLVEQYYLRAEMRTHHLRSLNAVERYQQCKSVYGDLFGRIPNEHLASFISLTPETLSRIKSNSYKCIH
jgi:CRP/FNR family transcriptional regulator, anaerobic regulatory protein